MNGLNLVGGSSSVLLLAPCVGGVEPGWIVGGGRVVTRCWVLRDQAWGRLSLVAGCSGPPSLKLTWWVEGLVGLLFEIWIVDASIPRSCVL